ncbi:hypothetical protein K2P97_08900 [bacterium]|nr:hypothetical protein [bacterium]
MGINTENFNFRQMQTLSWKELTSMCERDSSLRNVIFDAAIEKRKSLNINSIVVAGSAGKTTVKEMLGYLYKQWLNPAELTISEENQNTKIALASQIIKVDSSVKAGIFEVGARKVGDFSIPLQILNPSTVVLINIGTAHLGEFGSLKNLLKEKLSVLDSKDVKNRVVFGDDERILDYLHKKKMDYISFGYKKHNRVQILLQNEYSLELSVDGKILKVDIDTSFPNIALNVAAVVAVAVSLVIPMRVCIKSFKNFNGVKRRFELCHWGTTEVIDDAYNASPESMQAGIEKFSEISKRKKIILVLGSMLELGNASEIEHRKIGRYINSYFREHIEHNLVRLVLVGEAAKEIATDVNLKRTQINWFADVDLAKTYLETMRWHYDMIYLKASKSINLVKLLQPS